MNPGRRALRPLVRPYVETGGRARPTPLQERYGLERMTMLHAVAMGPPAPQLTDAQRSALELLQAGALSLVETATYMSLPVSVAKVVAADLIEAGLVKGRPPIPQAAPPSIDLLERLANGLKGLKSVSS